MDYQITRGEKGKIEVRVTVAGEDFSAQYDEILGKFANDAEVPGFRKGKAPAKIVEERVGYAKILNEAASGLVSKHLLEVLEKEKIFPIVSPNVVFESLTLGNPFIFVATVHEKPKVTVGDWKKIKVTPVKPKDIGEKEVDEAMRNIFEVYGKQKETSDKQQVTTLRQGYTGQASDQENDGGKTEESEEGKFIYDASGKKVFLGKKPADADSSGKAVADAASVEPRIDDEFAKKVGAPDLATLRAYVKADLQRLVSEEANLQIEEAIFTELEKLATVEIPEILVDDEVQRLVVKLSGELEKRNKGLEDYFKERQITAEQLRDELKTQAEKNIKTSLSLEEIGRAEKVTVSAEEIEKVLASYGDQVKEAHKADLRRYVAANMFQVKTLDLIKKELGV